MTTNAIPAVFEPDDLLTMPDGDNYELIDGRLREKKMGAESDEIGIDREHADKALRATEQARSCVRIANGFQVFSRKAEAGSSARHCVRREGPAS